WSRSALYRAARTGGTVQLMPASAAPAPPARSAPPAVRLSLWPGLLASLAVAVASMAAAQLLPGLSALVIAIVAGVLVANLTSLPAALAPGLQLSSKKLLRAGIVLLGLQVALGELLGLGAP